jgi:RNA polymerase-binding protein DksA
MRIQQITTRLLERRTELLARYYGEVERATEEQQAHQSEDIENATDQWDARILSRMSDADAIGLGRIAAALQRLSRGTYGRCGQCGATIEQSRLKALPEADSCYDCARSAEAQFRAAR